MLPEGRSSIAQAWSTVREGSHATPAKGSDDEEIDAGGGVPTMRIRLFSDEKLADIVHVCRAYEV